MNGVNIFFLYNLYKIAEHNENIFWVIILGYINTEQV